MRRLSKLLLLLHTAQSICVCIGVVWFIILFFFALYLSLFWICCRVYISYGYIFLLLPLFHTSLLQLQMLVTRRYGSASASCVLVGGRYQFYLNYLHAMRCNSDIFCHVLPLDQECVYQLNNGDNQTSKQQYTKKKVKPVKRKRETAIHIHTDKHTYARCELSRIDKSIDICVIRNVIMLLPYFVLLAFAFSPFLRLLLLLLRLKRLRPRARPKRRLPFDSKPKNHTALNQCLYNNSINFNFTNK